MSFKITKAQHVLAVDDFEAAVTYFTEKLGSAYPVDSTRP